MDLPGVLGTVTSSVETRRLLLVIGLVTSSSLVSSSGFIDFLRPLVAGFFVSSKTSSVSEAFLPLVVLLAGVETSSFTIGAVAELLRLVTGFAGAF